MLPRVDAALGSNPVGTAAATARGRNQAAAGDRPRAEGARDDNGAAAARDCARRRTGARSNHGGSNGGGARAHGRRRGHAQGVNTEKDPDGIKF